MKAMVLEEAGKPLVLKDVPIPIPGKDQILIRVLTCGVCRTDQHIVDGELPPKKLPLIPGHQIVGMAGDKLVGVAWLGKSCGKCPYCLSKRENLCDNPLFTGYSIDGGYAEYCVADKYFVYPLSSDPIKTAPLMCAGMVGYRALKMTEGAKTIGFYGFGSSAQILIQIAKDKQIAAFTRKGDTEAQNLAKKLGAVWVGSSQESPPFKLDAAIIFASDGKLIPKALQDVKKGGTIVCAGIHMSDIPSFPYSILWEERILRSIANLTRQDGEELLRLAKGIDLDLQITTYPLEEANQALSDLRKGRLTGAAVLTIIG